MGKSTSSVDAVWTSVLFIRSAATAAMLPPWPMRILIKTLQQKQIPLDVEPADTILEVKQKAQKAVDAEPERQKLIFSGKILDNAQTVQSAGLKEGDFVVLMVALSQPKKQPPVAERPKEPASLSEGALVTGSAYEESVARMVEMGFPREEVVRAMRAGFNNPDRAVEYLTNGFPNSIDFEESEPLDSAVPVDAAIPADAEDAHALDFLRNDPQFRQLRTMVQQNPQLIGPILEQIGQTSPELFQLIDQHRDEFIAIMNEGTDDDYEEGEDQPGDRTQYIQITEEEKAAIERLEALGFDKARAIEAYFACDKNENLAANFLFENTNDD